MEPLKRFPVNHLLFCESNFLLQDEDGLCLQVKARYYSLPYVVWVCGRYANAYLAAQSPQSSCKRFVYQ